MRIGRVYDEPSSDDGLRVLVDRLWPRGLSKEKARIDLWDKDVAPSAALRRWYGHDAAKAAEFAHRYRRELTEGPSARALADLVQRAGQGDVLLLTATKALDLSQANVLCRIIAESAG